MNLKGANNQTETPVDIPVAAVEEFLSHSLDTLGVRLYEQGDKFDKTLIYLSGGAIALTYGLLFKVSNTDWSVAFLLAAMACWVLTCIKSLCLINSSLRSLAWRLNGLKDAVLLAKECMTKKESLSTLMHRLHRQRPQWKLEDSTFRQAYTETQLKNIELLKGKIKDVSSETAVEEGVLQDVLERERYTSTSSANAWNIGIFAVDCFFFGVYTVLCVLNARNNLPSSVDCMANPSGITMSGVAAQE